MKKLRLLTTICLILGAYQTWATPKDENYKRRKKMAVRQLDSLITVNQANNIQGLAHKNWYIFSDTEPITEVGIRFFFKDRNILKTLNEQIRKFNKENEVEFYVKLSGLRALEYESLLIQLGFDDEKKRKYLDSLKAQEINFAQAAAETLDDYYQLINKQIEKNLKKARSEEVILMKDIYTSSKLGKYGAILGVTKFYFYHYSTGTNNKVAKKLYVQFAKSFAFGRGFSESFMEFLKDDTYNDEYAQKIENLGLMINKMALDYQQKGQGKLGEIGFSNDPDQALKNYVRLLSAYLVKQKNIHVNGGYNVVYLVNVTGNFKGMNATQTQEELRKITIEANKYFQILKVKTRCALYAGKPEDFRFDLLGVREGVVFIGGKNENDASDMITAIEALAKPNTGATGKEHEANQVFADSLKNNFKFDYQNPERSSVGLRDGYNRIALHYERSKSASVISEYKAAKMNSKISAGFRKEVVNPAEIQIAHIRVNAYSLVHGVGHNAELSFANGKQNNRWNHYGGVMADGNEIELAGSLMQRMQPSYLRQYQPIKTSEREIWISRRDAKTIENVTLEELGYSKGVFTYKELEHKVVLRIEKEYIRAAQTDGRRILSRDFVFDQKFIQSDKYQQFLIMYPGVAPNHAYKYSLEKYFGVTKAKANNLLGKIILQ